MHLEDLEGLVKGKGYALTFSSYQTPYGPGVHYRLLFPDKASYGRGYNGTFQENSETISHSVLETIRCYEDNDFPWDKPPFI